ncbi:MAG: hypothetical protein F4X69_15860 [Gemmatimonadetes bacterium]|nr:hypothetical protein [Gemmatimonadota bacterium]
MARKHLVALWLAIVLLIVMNAGQFAAYLFMYNHVKRFPISPEFDQVLVKLERERTRDDITRIKRELLELNRRVDVLE